jgi:ubiquinone/menaquinone biosynthesis C-methylase UbiE
LKSQLIDFIVCPICLNRFNLKIDIIKKNEIIKGKIICENNHKFHIRKGIPRLVVNEQKDITNTEKPFSTKWKKFHKTYQNEKWISMQKKWFLDRFGWKNILEFKKFLKTRKYILEAGTGVGNTAFLLSSNKQSQIFAIDISNSIEFAYKKYDKVKNIHFIQADIQKMPFKKKFFDFILSDQVLHHTNNTKKSFKILTKHLQKKGIISVYIYKKKGPIREFTDDYIRKSSTKMSEKKCVELSKELSQLGKNLAKIKTKIKIPQDIPLLKIKAGTYDVQRFIYWNFIKCWWSKDVPFEQSIATNFDWYFPKFAFRHTSNEVKKWFYDSKIKITHLNEIESGISISGTIK